MPKNNETTTKFKVDISDLKKGIQEANRQIRLANAEFKAASSGMENWSKSADGISSKLSSLDKVLSSQKKILKSYEDQLALIEKEYGKNSKEADEMRIKIANQQATVNRTTSEINKYRNELQTLQAEQKKSADAANQQASALDKLKNTIAQQKSTLESLKSQYASVVLEQGKNSAAAKSLASQISSLSGDLAKNEQQLEMTEDAADKLDKTLQDVGDDADKAGSGGFTVLKGALANLVADGIGLALNGLKRLGQAIVDVGKQSIANYANYEQLVGGVETLFGAQGMSLEEYAKSVGKSTEEVKKEYDSLLKAQKTVFDKAAGAYKTAGMSANDYMETVTSFSASLISGLNGDTAKAAKIADLAITDMSDNANKMGTSMELIQNAYGGFAKQNYTMLDNLKLGYGGTQAEMARLINDSGVLGDAIEVTAKTVNDVSFDKIIEAIHKIQDEMGITGTTAKEAADTIEGSKNAMQAAWQNLLTGLADEDADLDTLFDNLIESAETYLNNMLPRIETLIGNVVDFAKEKLKERFPEVYESISDVYGKLKEIFDNIKTIVKEEVLPILQEIGGWLKDTLLPVIQDIIKWIVDNKDVVIAALAGIGTAIVAWNLASVVTNILKMVKALKTMGAAAAFSAAKQWLLNTALFANPIGLVVAAIAGLVAAFVVLWNRSEEFRNFWINLWETVKEKVSVAWEWIKKTFTKLGEFFSDIWGGIKEKALELWTSVTGFFSDAWLKIQEIWGTVTGFFGNLWESIKEIFSTIATWIYENVFLPIIEFFQPVITYFTEAWAIIKELAAGCWEAIKLIWSIVSTWFDENVIQPVKKFFTEAWDNIKQKASDTWEGIKAVWTVVSTWFDKNVITPVEHFFVFAWDTIKEAASDAWEKIKETWEKVKGWFDENVVTPVKDFFTETWNKVKSGAEDAWEGIKSVFAPVAEWFEEKFTKAWEKVKAVFSTGGKIFDGIKEGIIDGFKTVVNAIIRGINKVIAIPFNAINDTLDKIAGVSIAGVKPFSGLVSRFSIPEIPELAQGGVLRKGQMGLLEGDGAEAVVPLDQNKKWIAATARELKNALVQEGILGGLTDVKESVVNNNYTFTQNNTSPKALSRLEIYRQTRNQLAFAKGV